MKITGKKRKVAAVMKTARGGEGDSGEADNWKGKRSRRKDNKERGKGGEYG